MQDSCIAEVVQPCILPPSRPTCTIPRQENDERTTERSRGKREECDGDEREVKKDTPRHNALSIHTYRHTHTHTHTHPNIPRKPYLYKIYTHTHRHAHIHTYTHTHTHTHTYTYRPASHSMALCSEAIATLVALFDNASLSRSATGVHRCA
jgi:ABC-type nickel/cobalt efflux system permease component RcnA